MITQPSFALLSVLLITSFLQRPFACNGFKILFIVDSMNSHVMLHSRLGLQLARLGHDVRVLAPSNARVPDFVRRHQKRREIDNSEPTPDDRFLSGGKFNFTTFEVDGDTPYLNTPEFSENILHAALTKSPFQRFKKTFEILETWQKHVAADIRRLVENRRLMNELHNSGFQFIVIDGTPMLFAIPPALGVPFAPLSVSFDTIFYRVPRLASFSPTFGLEFSDSMTFQERLISFVTMLFFQSSPTIHLLLPATDGNSAVKNCSISLKEAFYKSSLWLMVEDSVVGYPMPLMPNTIPVGDIMAGSPGLPLPPDLQNFIVDSADGVVVVSFGSYFDSVPNFVVDKFCDAFRRLPDGVRVVWKLKLVDPCSSVDRVRTSPWIPQNDLLADPRTRLFITHGGLNSLMETVYHAKPVIAFPLFVDQPANAAAVERKGFAIRMDIGDFSSDELLSNIETMLSDEKYTTNARRWSRILRDRRDTPAERVSHMIEHVIKYGDSHLRTGAYELNVFQFLMFDLFSVLFVSVTVCLMLSVFCIGCVIRKCSKLSRSKTANKIKSE